MSHKCSWIIFLNFHKYPLSGLGWRVKHCLVICKKTTCATINEFSLMIASYYQTSAQVLFWTLFIRIIRTTLNKPTPFFRKHPLHHFAFLQYCTQNTPIYIYNTAMFEEEESCWKYKCTFAVLLKKPKNRPNKLHIIYKTPYPP